jgi:uncharacterized protein YfdQ (DUF2303 family)
MNTEKAIEATIETTNDTTPTLAAGAALSNPRLNPAKDGIPYVVVPEGYKVRELPTETKPKRPVAKPTFTDAASFIEYVNDHKTGDTALYGNYNARQMTCVFDDFLRGNKPIDEQASYRGFRAALQPDHSREWGIWKNKNAQPMKPADFGLHIENNLPDIAEPNAADLMQMAYDFRVSQNGTLHAQQRMQDGSYNFQIAMENNQVGEAKLPKTIKLNIAIFENTAPVVVEAYLRFSAKSNELAIWYDIIRPDHLIDSEFKKIWAHVATETGRNILRGTPE